MGDCFRVSLVTEGNAGALERGALPLLVACLRNDGSLLDNMSMLNALARFCRGEMDVFYAMEGMLPYFRKKFGVACAPSFMFMNEGVIVGTILGKVSFQELVDHAAVTLLSLHRAQSSGGAHLPDDFELEIGIRDHDE